jgi:peptide/nickel transport system substrate-binding protein
MVIFAWVGSPFLSGNKDIYSCDGGSNFGGYCNTAVDAKMTAANKSASMAAEAALYGAADLLMWNDMPTLPLYQKANFAAWKGLTGVVVNPTSAGITWNADKWATS